MHDHARQHRGKAVDRSYLVTLSDVHRRMHQIRVDSPCACDMWQFVNRLDDLPFAPDFMDVKELVDAVPGGVASE